MSIKVMTEVWEHAPVEQGALLVLLALADNASEDTRQCWPGLGSLSRKSRLQERQVRNCIASLRDLGIISVRRNAGPAGTNLYQIMRPSEWPEAVDRQKLPGAPTGNGEVVDRQPIASGDRQPIAGDPSEDPSDLDPSESGFSLTLIPTEPERPKEDPFEAFWNAYPRCRRKADRSLARELFHRIVAGRHKRIPQISAEAIVGALRRYAETNPDSQYIPAPTVWLNKERWIPWLEDCEPDAPEPLSPRAVRNKIIAHYGYVPQHPIPQEVQRQIGIA